MKIPLRVGRARATFVAVSICASLVADGCHRPGAHTPLAPSLRGPVTDLGAIRAGNQIWLSWTMPAKRTGKLTVNGVIAVQVCRRKATGGACENAGELLHLAPGSPGTFSETLPEALNAGPPRVLYYAVELVDRHGTPTGLSNQVPTMAGTPPPAISGFTAALTKAGVSLRWAPFSGEDGAGTTAVRIHRIEILPLPTQAMRDGLVPMPMADMQSLLVEHGAGEGHALDTNPGKGKTYTYTAQRVFRMTVGGQTLELDGMLSQPARVEVPE
jgi:hypothetical protein